MSAYRIARKAQGWGRPTGLTRLLEERDVGGDILLILVKCFPELRGEEFVFDVHADLRTKNKHHDGQEEERQGSHHKACGEQDAKHGGVNRMTHEAIRSRHDELVIGAEAGINAPLASEGAGAGPRKENPEREEDDGENDLPGLRMAQPELALPQEGVAMATITTPQRARRSMCLAGLRLRLIRAKGVIQRSQPTTRMV